MEYDIKRLPYVLFGTCLALKVLTFLFLVLLYFATRRRENRKDTYEMTETNVTIASSVTSDKSSVSGISLTYSSMTSQTETQKPAR